MDTDIVAAPSKSAARCGFEDLAAQINEAHKLAREHAESAIDHAFRAGELLAEAKAKVPHGHWLPWLRENVKFSERSAQAYMRLAAKRETVLANIADDADGISVREALGHLSKPLRSEYQDESQRQQTESDAAERAEAAEVASAQKTMLEEAFGGDVWAFATHLVERPFCRDDVVGPQREWIKSFANKLLYQADLPARASFALQCLREYDPIPLLRAVPDDELIASLNRLGELATGRTMLPMEANRRRTARSVMDTIELLTSLWCGAILEEFERRESIDGDTFVADAEDVLRRFKATTQARMVAIADVKARRERGEFATSEDYLAASDAALAVRAAA